MNLLVLATAASLAVPLAVSAAPSSTAARDKPAQPPISIQNLAVTLGANGQVAVTGRSVCRIPRNDPARHAPVSELGNVGALLKQGAHTAEPGDLNLTLRCSQRLRILLRPDADNAIDRGPATLTVGWSLCGSYRTRGGADRVCYATHIVRTIQVR